MIGNIPAHTAHFADRKDYPSAGGLFDDIQNRFTDTPALHEQTLKPQGVGAQSCPQQMAVETGNFVPDGTQVLRPFRNFNFHQAFDGLAVTPAMTERTDAADPFRYIHIFLEAALLYQFFQPPVNIPNGRNRLYNFFVLQLEIEMDRLRQYRMLGTKRYNCTFAHISFLLPQVLLPVQQVSPPVLPQRPHPVRAAGSPLRPRPAVSR